MNCLDIEATNADRAALADDLRGMALAHASLDELGVPRSNGSGRRLTLFGRIEALRAGKFDLAKLSPPTPLGSL